MEQLEKQPEQRDCSREEAMKDLMDNYETPLLRYAARFLNDDFAAQDVVQDTFIRLYSRWKEGLQPGKQISAWLYRVTHNLAVDHIRRESRRRILNFDGQQDIDLRHEEQAHNKREQQRIEDVLVLIQKLPETERQIMLLSLQEHKNYREIADITGLSLGSVSNTMRKATKHMQKLLKEGGAL